MARPLLPNDLWDEIGPLLSPPRPRLKGVCRPIENRAALTGILFVLRSGLPWVMLPAEMGCGCGMSCWRRLRDWQEAAVWAQLHQVLLERLHAAGQIDWSRASLDWTCLASERLTKPVAARWEEMAKPLLPDGLWAEIAPLLPPEPAKPEGGRPQRSNRAALTGIRSVSHGSRQRASASRM